MNYGRYLLLFPLGLSAACSDRAAPVDSSTGQSRGENGANDVETQGASLFLGSGTSGAGEALGAEIPPSTAHDCVPVGIGTANPGAGPATVTCFYDEEDASDLAATIERRLEIVNDQRWIHLRLTFNPNFVDNTYGETAVGWGDAEEAAEPAPPGEPGAEPAPPGEPGMPPAAPADKPKPKKKGGHTFKDLVGSDHAEFQLFNGAGDLTMQFKVDYIEASESTPSGYACAGVTGGEGKMVVGESDWILGATTSLDRNLNGCGWSAYLEDSPATDESFSPNPDAPTWDYRVVYEAWVADEPFGDSGFGEALIEYVHASPSKYEDNTLVVVPGECIDPPVQVNDGGTTPPPDTTEPEESMPVDAGGDEPTDPPILGPVL